jgi:hypothetical protein
MQTCINVARLQRFHEEALLNYIEIAEKKEN